jgi:protein ImuA
MDVPPMLAFRPDPTWVSEGSVRSQPRLAQRPGVGDGMAPGRSKLPLQVETVHPALWRAHQLGRNSAQAVTTGYAALDDQLPGRGWPRRALTELLLPHAGVGEIRLLSPALAATLREGRLVMLFDPPACLSGWALAQLGIDPEQLLVVYTQRSPQASPSQGLPGADSHAQAGGDALWALEQSLKSGHVGALLAWLSPRLRAERLRRLQLAAQAHDGPAFMLREWSAAERPSPAPLRLALRSAAPDRLAVRVLKRRGPLLAHPIVLTLPAVLPASVAASIAERATAQPQPQTAQAWKCISR